MLTPKVNIVFLYLTSCFEFSLFICFNCSVVFRPAGVHAVLKTGSWVRYCVFDLATGKAEQENNFPTSNLAFLGQSERNVAIFTAGQVRQSHSLIRFMHCGFSLPVLTFSSLHPQESPIILRDGNGTIYPMAKDCMGGIRDPDWLDLPPIASLGMGVHSLVNLPSNSTIKKKAAIIIMAVEVWYTNLLNIRQSVPIIDT